jgi:hypothetical protein
MKQGTAKLNGHTDKFYLNINLIDGTLKYGDGASFWFYVAINA